MDPAMAIEVAAMSHQRSIDEATARGDSEIQRFYRNSTVFITGGSGFMGKQLIEKLFRSCEITKMFVLMRPKKGKPIRERLQEILEDPVFDKLRKQKPQFEMKIVLIEGDAAEIRLGVSDQDWETVTTEVDVIYHMAATTRFDETLKIATLINVRGTREAIILGKACNKLKSFVHVSTAYTQAHSSKVDHEIYEKFYPSPILPETLISMAETMDVDRLNNITTSLIDVWPNTYTFCKSVSEEVVRTMSDGLPLVIVRPGIVLAPYREPSPGWLDMSCVYGATGLYLGLGLGVIHVLNIDKKSNFGIIPCDLVNNAIITAGSEARHSTGGDAAKIYTVSNIARNALNYGQMASMTDEMSPMLFTPRALYYCYMILTSSPWLFIINHWIHHLIPAYTTDFVCRLLRKEQKFVKIHKKIYKMSNALRHFTLKSWQFDDKNLDNLYKSLSKTDKTIFNFDVPSINWNEYLGIYFMGIRKYIIKDGLKGTELARRKQKWFRILHYSLICLCIYIFYKIFSFVYFIFTGVVSLVLEPVCNVL